MLGSSWARALAAAACVLSSVSLAAAADSVEAFYKTHPIELYIGTTPGGGYDLYGRLVGNFLSKHVPGNPAVLVRNMPGAGHLSMTNWLYNVAPRDGTAIAIAPQALAIDQALGSAGIQYDASKFTWIGRAAPVVEVTYTWFTSPTKTLEDARRRVTVMGGSGPTSPTVFYLKALNNLAGTKFKIISGYPGGGETELAMQRGEVEGNSKAWASMKVDNAAWLRDKKVNILLQYALERAPDLPDVPLMMELGRTQDERDALKLFAMGDAMGRSIMGAPDIPRDRLQVLRAAFDATMQDPDLQEFVKSRQIDVGPPYSGQQLEALVAETLQVPQRVVQLAKSSIE